MSPGSASLLLLVLFCAGTAVIGIPPPPGDVVEGDEALAKPYPVSKSGVCPADVEYPPCDLSMKDQCKTDQSCKGTMKCCFYNCRKQCVLPLGSKKGSCPYFDDKSCLKSLINVCRSDKQCPGTERCCYYKCQFQCVPKVTVKPGTCPITVARCRTPLPAPLCKSDNDCTGRKKCCTPLCGLECTDPIEYIAVSEY